MHSTRTPFATWGSFVQGHRTSPLLMMEKKSTLPKATWRAIQRVDKWCPSLHLCCPDNVRKTHSTLQPAEAVALFVGGPGNLTPLASAMKTMGVGERRGWLEAPAPCLCLLQCMEIWLQLAAPYVFINSKLHISKWTRISKVGDAWPFSACLKDCQELESSCL